MRFDLEHRTGALLSIYSLDCEVLYTSDDEKTKLMVGLEVYLSINDQK